MDNLEEHYNFLNTIIKGGEGGNNKCDKEECCKLKENYQNDNGTITCKECSNIITNICNNPEWRYYGSKDNKNNDPTRCGMPINSLLPELFLLQFHHGHIHRILTLFLSSMLNRS